MHNRFLSPYPSQPTLNSTSALRVDGCTLAPSGEPLNPKPFRFGGFLIDVAARTVVLAGQERHLEPRGFDLLVYLIEHRQRVVSKTELLDALWPTRHVTENVVARCVMKVRHVLADDAHCPQIIRTVHRVGYRFNAELLRTEESHCVLFECSAGNPEMRASLMAELRARADGRGVGIICGGEAVTLPLAAALSVHRSTICRVSVSLAARRRGWRLNYTIRGQHQLMRGSLLGEDGATLAAPLFTQALLGLGLAP